MTDLLIDSWSRDMAPWPCDCGAQVQAAPNTAGRVVRAKWLKCLGGCLRWFWSEDVVNNRLCGHCTRGEVRDVTRPPSAHPAKERAARKPPRPHPNQRPVIADGQRYPSIIAAARALGLAPRAISDRIKRKWRGYESAD